MNTTVRTTFTVLMISSALVIGLVVAAPAARPAADVAPMSSGVAFTANVQPDAARIAEDAMIATLTAEAPVVAGLAATLQNTATPPAAAKPARRTSGKSRRIRQSMAMPFFSFAPRG